MRPVRTFLRSYRGTHPLGRSALSLLRCGEHPRGYPDVAFGRCTGTLRQRGRERLPGKRGRTRTVPQHGKAVSSEVTSGCPKRSEGGFPVGTRTITTFPSGTAHPTWKQKQTQSPRVVTTRGLSICRFRRQSLPRCRSPPQPSAHEYAAPDPAPSPPGTRPHGESPWRSRRDPHRRTAP